MIDTVPSLPISMRSYSGRTMGPPLAEHRTAVECQAAFGVHLHAALAGIGLALAILQHDQAVALDREVQLATGGHERAGGR